ncbi:hypothetical protein LDENG_00231200 [Lucifuga dentata]|nr:hypothetical protein LDENG_00231200 [Lucifuga dentata]
MLLCLPIQNSLLLPALTKLQCDGSIWFIGDEADPLRIDLLRPYPQRQLDHQQRIFNYRLSQARRVFGIFGILANRWRVFHSIMLLIPDKVTEITLAAASPHNFLCSHRLDLYLQNALADRGEHRLVEGQWRRQGLGSLYRCTPRGSNYSVKAKQQRDIMKECFVSPQCQVDWQDRFV